MNRGLVLGLVFVAFVHLLMAQMGQANSGGGKEDGRISDLDYEETKRLEDARLAIEQAGQWSDQDSEACSQFYDRPSEFARCLHEEAYTRFLFILRRGCMGSLVSTCFEQKGF